MINNKEQTDIFSLFGIEDEYEIKKKEEEERLRLQAEERQKIVNSKKVENVDGSNKKKEEKFKLNSDTVIYFYTETYDVNDYFTTEELEYGIASKKNGEVEYKPITETHLKNRMKKDLPVLDTGAQMVYIEKKNVVSVVLQAKKKGLVEGPDGSSLISKQIPFELLKDFIAVSKYFSDRYGTEVHADIYYDRDVNDFFMEFPKQIAHKYWVQVKDEDILEQAIRAVEGNFFKCMEIHSHHTMPAMPSGQDDISEIYPSLLYAIVGNINNIFPDITVRWYSKERNKHYNIKPSKVFETPFSQPSHTNKYDLKVVEVTK